MLQENTGAHFLDSGGAYGRHWERNIKLPKDIEYWDNRPDVTIKAHIYDHDTPRLELDVTLDLYHFLERALEYDEEMDNLFQTWDRLHPDLSYDESMESFIKAGKSRHWKIGEFGSGYTYNNENLLSQDFLWHSLDADGEEYIFLQIHNGCDARGGFTAPHIFRLTDDYYNLLSYDRYTISCGDHYWDFESAGYYEMESSTGQKFKDYAFYNYEDLDDDEKEEFDNKGVQLVPEDQMNLIDGVRKFKPYSLGFIVVKDDELYCPHCGQKMYASHF